jgi:hypothetical protein
MRLTALFGFGWIGLLVDGHFTGLPRPCQRRLTPPRGSHRTPRYLQQPFLPPFFVPFFTSLTSFRLCSSGLGELAFQGRVTRQIHKVVP